jgi:acyl carrier protein
MRSQIRKILSEHARLPIEVETLSDDSDLYKAGMSSHASVGVMLALEDGFDLEFPDAMLKREVFQSIDAIARALTQLRDSAAA